MLHKILLKFSLKLTKIKLIYLFSTHPKFLIFYQNFVGTFSDLARIYKFLSALSEFVFKIFMSLT